MKKTIFIIFLTVLSIGSWAQAKKIHTDGNGKIWQNAVLRADGFTELNGVEAFCDKTICDGEEYVFIKFINNNDYKVRVEWKDAVWVNGVWYYSKNENNKVFYLDPKSTTTGQCDGEQKLKVKISSIIDDPQSFQHFTVSGLAINK